MINRMVAVLIGIVVIAIGAALVVGVLTQTTTEDKNKQMVTTPGILPFVLPALLFGFPTLAIGAIIAALGFGVIFFGWQFGY